MIKTQKQNLNHLIEAFRDGNENEFIFLLELYAFKSNVSLQSVGIQESLIEHVLSTPNSLNFIKICLKYGEHLYKKNSNGLNLINYAIKSMCAENLKTLVDHLIKISSNNVAQQMVLNSEMANKNNLLHEVLINLSSENSKECKIMIEILLRLGSNPNHLNADRITPFELLLDKIQNNYPGSGLIEAFLNSSIPSIEIDNSEYNINFVSNQNSEKLMIRKRSNPDVANLLELINQGNETEFISMLKEAKLRTQIPFNFPDIMRKSIEMNFAKGVRELLQCYPDESENKIRNRYDINSCIPAAISYKIDNKPLLFFAIKLCRPKIVKVLLDLDYAQFQNELPSHSVLHEICSMKNVESDKDFQKCFNLIVKDRRCDYNLVNGFDSCGKTPLMYACENDHKEIIYELLRRGAYIGHECIVSNLSEETFKRVLDECIVPTSDISDQDCAVQINFKFLIPPKYTLTRNDETKALKLIASQPRFKSLLTHPVLTSYLELKWKRVNVLVYIALFLYFIFFVYLSLFILNFFSDEIYRGDNSKSNGTEFRSRSSFIEQTTSIPMENKELKEINVLKVLFGRKKRDVTENETLSQNSNQTNATTIERRQTLPEYIESHSILYITSLIGTLILTFCEIVQLIFTWKTYFLKLSNWVDCALLFLAYVVLLNVFSSNVELFRKFRAVLFLVIAVQSFILLSRVSKLSLQLEIFKKVSKTFIKFIMLYFMLIFAFAMAFYTLYGSENTDQTKIGDDKKNDVKKSDKDDENGFQNILISVITVIRMMLSDFDKMKLEPDDKFNSIIFLAFVLLITIILFNLLNALAINDTQQIMKEAEIVDVRKRIGIVDNCERILAFLKIEFFNIYSNLICNGRIILKINKDNYVRVDNKQMTTKTLNTTENGHFDMLPLSDDDYDMAKKKYIKVQINQIIKCYKLHRSFGNYRLFNPKLTLGNDNMEKIIKHIKNLIEEEQ